MATAALAQRLSHEVWQHQGSAAHTGASQDGSEHPGSVLGVQHGSSGHMPQSAGQVSQSSVPTQRPSPQESGPSPQMAHDASAAETQMESHMVAQQ